MAGSRAVPGTNNDVAYLAETAAGSPDGRQAKFGSTPPPLARVRDAGSRVLPQHLAAEGRLEVSDVLLGLF